METENMTTELTVGMVYDVFELSNADTSAFNVYDNKGNKCLWREIPSVRYKLPKLTEEQRALKVLRVSVCASAIYLDVDSEKYRGPYIHQNGAYC